MPIGNPTYEIDSEVAIEATDKYLPATTTLVVMNPLEHHSLMRFTAMVFQQNLTSKAYTLIDTVASLNIVSRKLLINTDFYKYCKAAPKLVTKVANEQCISTENILIFPEIITIGGPKFTYL